MWRAGMTVSRFGDTGRIIKNGTDMALVVVHPNSRTRGNIQMSALASEEKAGSAALDECLARYRNQKDNGREQTAEELSRLIAPLLLKYARYHMKSGSHGRDFCSPEDLAQAAWVKIFEKDEILAEYRVGGGIKTYLSTIVHNVYLSDLRRLSGRDNAMPRVYVHDSEVLENMSSERRSQSGYAQLRQTKEILRRYLRQLPGKVVEIPTSSSSENPSKKRVTLTRNHADLLVVWMEPTNEDSTWKELSKLIGKPVGTIKRWFSEVTVHLFTEAEADRRFDRYSDARNLCDIYDIKEPFRGGENGDNAPEGAEDATV